MTDEQQAPARRSFPWQTLGILITGIGVVALLVSFYLAYFNLLNNHNRLEQKIISLQSKMENDQASIDAAQKGMTDLQQGLQQWRDEMTSQQQQALTELKGLEQSNRDKWIVSEIRYLITLANDNLQIGDNLPLVITLLKTADSDIHDSDDVKMMSVRKALTDDIAALQTVPVLDVAGIYLKLSALNNQVDNLPLQKKQNTSSAVTSEEAQQETTNESWWKKILHSAWGGLQKVVTVRHAELGKVPFVPADAQYYLYQNIHSMLSQATWAVLHRQAEIYKNSLSQAAAWIKDYFDTTDYAAGEMLKALDQLQTIDLKPKLPTIQASLDAIHDVDSAR